MNNQDVTCMGLNLAVEYTGNKCRGNTQQENMSENM
jgi:hypothetical protein